MNKNINFTPRAWTGGNGDYKNVTHPDFPAIRHQLFREQVAQSLGLGFWQCAGTSSLQRARIFWNRASLDAMASLNLN